MSVVCKFQCNEVARQTQGERVRFNAISGKENEPWSKWTPSGSFEFFVTNPACFGAFEPGKNYLITIDPAPEETPPAS